MKEKNLQVANYEKSPDIFVYGEKRYEIRGGLVRQHFKKHPESWNQLTQILSRITISCNKRKVIFHFGINGKDLEIIDIQCLRNEHEYKSRLKEIFPKKEGRKINWFNSVLVISLKELKCFGVLNMLKEDKPYYILDFENGTLIKELFLKENELNSFRKEQFLIFKQTKDYLDIIEKVFPIVQKCRKMSKDEFKEELKMKIPFITNKILK